MSWRCEAGRLNRCERSNGFSPAPVLIRGHEAPLPAGSPEPAHGFAPAQAADRVQPGNTSVTPSTINCTAMAIRIKPKTLEVSLRGSSPKMS